MFKVQKPSSSVDVKGNFGGQTFPLPIQPKPPVLNKTHTHTYGYGMRIHMYSRSVRCSSITQWPEQHLPPQLRTNKKWKAWYLKRLIDPVLWKSHKPNLRNHSFLRHQFFVKGGWTFEEITHKWNLQKYHLSGTIRLIDVDLWWYSSPQKCLFWVGHSKVYDKWIREPSEIIIKPLGWELHSV